MRLTLGPVLFNWPAAVWRDFYFRIADEAAVDTVVVGEVVCSKRMPFFESAMPCVIERLQRGGKEVLLASLALVTLERERRATATLAVDGLPVEANDVACLAALAGRLHAIGPLIQVYNEGTARYLANRGAIRICLTPELPAASIAAIAAAVPEATVEVLGFGRAPLAISARCYHARAEGLPMRASISPASLIGLHRSASVRFASRRSLATWLRSQQSSAVSSTRRSG
jgi:collagenase-like PrtC family protease